MKSADRARLRLIARADHVQHRRLHAAAQAARSRLRIAELDAELADVTGELAKLDAGEPDPPETAG